MSEPDIPINRNPKADKEIMARLLEAISYQRKLPAFSRGQMIYDFATGNVTIKDSQS